MCPVLRQTFCKIAHQNHKTQTCRRLGCNSGGTLMCPMLSVLATLKMGSCDVTSFSIVCTMRFQTSRPRPPPNFNVYIEATSHMCPVLRQTFCKIAHPNHKTQTCRRLGCNSGGTLMCPMLSVLATLKMGSCDVTSFSIVCTMRFQTSRPRPPPTSMLHRSDQSHVPRTATNILQDRSSEPQDADMQKAGL